MQKCITTALGILFFGTDVKKLLPGMIRSTLTGSPLAGSSLIRSMEESAREKSAAEKSSFLAIQAVAMANLKIYF